MRITAVLVWYDEPPELLAKTVRSWAAIADRLVAVDGAFEGYPAGTARSPASQVRAINEAAHETDMPVLMVYPQHLWSGHPEKRSYAIKVAKPRPDWFFFPDADEMVVEELGCRELLEGTELDAAAVVAESDGRPVRQPRLMRAVPGLRVDGLHYRYVTGDGRYLWNAPDHEQEPWLEVPLRLTHLRDERPAERLAAAKTYYQQRREWDHVRDG